ncbi:MAG: hypothetical protein IIA14_15730 [SAR324 cluster bacterium]|nr:hypothetical protein [SAR324 cluster bacterium]
MSNAIELLSRGKKAVVYVNKAKTFLNVSAPIDLETLISHMSPSAFEKAEVKLKLRQRLDEIRHKQQELFSESSIESEAD